jgi:hypothetical protein
MFGEERYREGGGAMLLKGPALRRMWKNERIKSKVQVSEKDE